MTQIGHVHSYIVIDKDDPQRPVIVSDNEGNPIIYADYITASIDAKQRKNAQVITLTP